MKDFLAGCNYFGSGWLDEYMASDDLKKFISENRPNIEGYEFKYPFKHGCFKEGYLLEIVVFLKGRKGIDEPHVKIRVDYSQAKAYPDTEEAEQRWPIIVRYVPGENGSAKRIDYTAIPNEDVSVFQNHLATFMNEVGFGTKFAEEIFQAVYPMHLWSLGLNHDATMAKYCHHVGVNFYRQELDEWGFRIPPINPNQRDFGKAHITRVTLVDESPAAPYWRISYLALPKSITGHEKVILKDGSAVVELHPSDGYMKFEKSVGEPKSVTVRLDPNAIICDEFASNQIHLDDNDLDFICDMLFPLEWNKNHGVPFF